MLYEVITITSYNVCYTKLLRGKAYQNLGMYKDAARAYLRYLKLVPDAPDKIIVHAELETLLKQIKRGMSHDQ